MSGQIETLCNQILSGADAIAGNIDRTSKPYYAYGQRFFQTNEGTPPQIRIRPTSFTTTQREKLSSYGTTGSQLTINQNIEVSIWGSTEQEVLNELSLFTKGIDRIKGTTNSEGINQPCVFETIDGEWVDTSSKNSQGEMMLLNYIVKINLFEPSGVFQTALVNTASIELSQSTPQSGSISGSYEYINTFTYTSGSY